MAHRIVGRLAASLVLLIALLSAHVTTWASYTAVYGFGDSLSDNGNLFAATGGTLPQPGDYFQGRFSNGPAAVEHLASGLGVSLYDFAYGGAQTGLLNGAVVAGGGPPALQLTGMLSQVGFFQSALGGGAADASALYFVWGGANDFQYQGYTPAVAQVAIQNLSTAIMTLYGLGARQFMVPGLADLGATPAGLASGQSTLLHQLSLGFNAGLNSGLAALSALPGIELTFIDILGAQHELIDHPGDFGLTNVTGACFTGYVGIPGTQCSDPSAYLYWDRIHPSATTHEVLGAVMLAAVVPEPDSLAVVLIALAALAIVGAARSRPARGVEGIQPALAP